MPHIVRRNFGTTYKSIQSYSINIIQEAVSVSEESMEFDAEKGAAMKLFLIGDWSRRSVS